MTEADPFRIRAHVPDFELISQGYSRASDAARSRWMARTDIAYGPGADDRLDLFFPERQRPGRPIHIFIHGGYWRANVKEDYAFLTEMICGSGSIAALVEYARLPAVRMETLVGQVRRAARWLRDNAVCFGGDPDAITASGHSAGAHLAFYLAACGPAAGAPPAADVRSLLLVSGVYDLHPIMSSFLQAEIDLRPEEAGEWSPVTSTISPRTRMAIAVGANETRPFIDQARSLAAALPGQPTPILVEGADHMSIVRDMGDVATPMGRLFRDFLTIGVRDQRTAHNPSRP